MARVVIRRSAESDMDALPSVILLRVRKVMLELEHWPHVSGAKPLRGALQGWFRKRIGDYRIVFSVRGDTVYIERVRIRRDVYED
jgi:mRNA interferase RelE/StbE